MMVSSFIRHIFIVFPVRLFPVIHHCVTAYSAICYDSLTPSDLYLKFNLYFSISSQTKLAVAIENICVSTGGHCWPGPTFRYTAVHQILNFCLNWKEKRQILSLTLCICFFSNNSECPQQGLAAVLVKPLTYQDPTGFMDLSKVPTKNKAAAGATSTRDQSLVMDD